MDKEYDKEFDKDEELGKDEEFGKEFDKDEELEGKDEKESGEDKGGCHAADLLKDFKGSKSELVDDGFSLIDKDKEEAGTVKPANDAVIANPSKDKDVVAEGLGGSEVSDKDEPSKMEDPKAVEAERDKAKEFSRSRRHAAADVPPNSTK